MSSAVSIGDIRDIQIETDTVTVMKSFPAPPPALSPWSALLTRSDLPPHWFNAAVVMATLGLFDIHDEVDVSTDLDAETYMPYVYVEWAADTAHGTPAHGLRCDADGAYTVISYGENKYVETTFSAPAAVDLLLNIRKMRRN